MDIFNDSKSDTNGNHTILHAKSSMGSDGFCKEDLLGKLKTSNHDKTSMQV